MVQLVTPDPAAVDPFVERLERNKFADERLRRASGGLQGIIKYLPSSDDLLVSDEALVWWRDLRDLYPQLYAGTVSQVSGILGRHYKDLIFGYVGPPRHGPRREIQLLGYEDLLAQPPIAWLNEGRLPERGFGCFFGDSGAGKTFGALDMALCAVRGAHWFGRPMKRCGAIYVATEGRLRDRASAYVQHHDLAATDLSLFRVIESAIDLSGHTADLDQLVRIVTATADQLGGVGLVVIDTLSRAMAGADENSAQGMGGFIASAKEIEEATGGLVLAIHHSGKNPASGARGHSSLRAATDVEIAFTAADDGLRTAKITKLRDGQDGEELRFRLQAVGLGDGRGSVVVVPTDEQPKPVKRQPKLGADERVALEALREEVSNTGVSMPYTSVLPGGLMGVTVEAWRNRFYARLGESREVEQAAKRQAWNRGRKGLIAKKLAGCWEDWAWIW